VYLLTIKFHQEPLSTPGKLTLISHGNRVIVHNTIQLENTRASLFRQLSLIDSTLSQRDDLPEDLHHKYHQFFEEHPYEPLSFTTEAYAHILHSYAVTPHDLTVT